MNKGTKSLLRIVIITVTILLLKEFVVWMCSMFAIEKMSIIIILSIGIGIFVGGIIRTVLYGDSAIETS